MHEIQLTSRNGNFYADSREVVEKIVNSLGYALQYENGIYTLVNKEEIE